VKKVNEEAIKALSGVLADNEETLIVNALGAKFGETGMSLRWANRKAKIYTIDETSQSDFGGLQNERDMFKERGMIELAPFPLKGTVREWGSEWMIGKIDLILLASDLDVWLPHMKDGGIVIIGLNYPFVIDMIEDFFDISDAIFRNEHNIAFRVEKGDGDGSRN
jgi:hypothetical protein